MKYDEKEMNDLAKKLKKDYRNKYGKAANNIADKLRSMGGNAACELVKYHTNITALTDKQHATGALSTLILCTLLTIYDNDIDKVIKVEEALHKLMKKKLEYADRRVNREVYDVSTADDAREEVEIHKQF